MIADKIKQRVANATVRLTHLDGQGVLVPGGFILTAAHCLEWSGTGAMALGDYFFEPIKTHDGRTFKAQVVAVDPVADIAALAPVDGQVLYDDCAAFEEFAAEVPGVPLFTRLLKGIEIVHVKQRAGGPSKGMRIPVVKATEEKFTVYVAGHKGNWVKATVARHGFNNDLPAAALWLRAEERIIGGDSGGPIVDRFGRLVGLVSWTSEAAHGETYDGRTPTPWTALPSWVANRIKAAAKSRRKVLT